MESGRARIHDANDPIGVELELALKHRVAIIPVLVGGAAMPSVNDLPDGIRDFAFRNAAKVDAGEDFNYHVDRLAARISEILNANSTVTALARSGGVSGKTARAARTALRIVGAALVFQGSARMILTLLFLWSNFPFANGNHLVWTIWLAAFGTTVAIGMATLARATWAPIVGVIVCLIGSLSDLWLMVHDIGAGDLRLSRLVLVPLPAYLVVFIAGILVYLRNPDLDRATA